MPICRLSEQIVAYLATSTRCDLEARWALEHLADRARALELELQAVERTANGIAIEARDSPRPEQVVVSLHR